MKKLFATLIFLLVGLATAHAQWTIAPASSCALHANVSVAAQAYANQGSYPITYLIIWLQSPSGSWTPAAVGTGANGSSINCSGNPTLDTTGTWNWDVRLDTSGPGGAPAGTQLATGTTTVGPTATTFSFSNLSFTYDGGTKTATVTPSPAGATYSSDLTKGPGAGSYTVSASANGSYSGSGSATLTINKANQAAISLSAATTSQPFGTSQTISVSGGSGTGAIGPYIAGQSAAGNATLSGTTLTANAGSGWVDLQGTRNADSNYNAAYATPVRVNFTTASASFAFSNLTYTYDGTAKTATVAPSPAGATYSSDLTKGPGAGSYTVSATANGNYAGSGAATLTINKANQSSVSISPASQSISQGGAASFTASGGGAGGYNWSGSASGTGSTNSVTFNTPGTYTEYAQSPGDGNYNASNTASATVTVNDTQAPSVPAGLSASSVTATSFTLNWSASTDNVGVTAYEVFQNGASLGTVTTTSRSITGLTQGTTYSMTVRARDAAANWSGQSGALNVQTIDTQAPSVPAGLSASSVTATSFTLNWSASTDNVGVTAYEVFQNGASLGTVTTTSRSVTGLIQGTTYPMTVRARDAAGNWSAQSSPSNIQTTDTQAPSVPAGLSAASVTATSFTLNWSASSDNVGVSGYEVYQNGNYFGTTTSTSMGVTGLTQGTTYAMTVRARDAVPNWSAQSSALNVQTTDTQAPTVPAGLNATSITLTSFILNWTASTDNVGVTGYEVFKNGTSMGATTATSLSLTGLTPGTTYAMTVRARDTVPNWSGQSTAANISTTADTTAPSVPTGLASSNLINTSFTLSWAASTDNVGVTGYEVFRNGTSIGTTTATSMNVTGLLPSTTYTLTVRARDAVPNWSVQSTGLGVTTTADPNADADGDGVPDVIEVQLGTNPNQAAQSDSTNSSQRKIHRPQ